MENTVTANSFILYLIFGMFLITIFIIVCIRIVNAEYKKAHDGLTRKEVEQLPERTEIVEIVAIRKNESEWDSEIQENNYLVKYISETGENKKAFVSYRKSKLLKLGKTALILKGNQILDIDDFALYEFNRREKMIVTVPKSKCYEIIVIAPTHKSQGFNPWLALHLESPEKQQKIFDAIKSVLTEEERKEFMKVYGVTDNEK